MVVLSASLDVFIFTAILIAGPWSYFALFKTSPKKPLNNDGLRTTLSVLVILHSLFILYNFIVCAPFNLFENLTLGLMTPSESIKNILLKHAGVPTLPQSLNMLLSRLSSFDARTLYVRFGHNVVQDCEICRTDEDFALYALPRPLLEYVREIGFVGLVTIRGSARSRWRTLGLAAVIGAGAVEVYWLATVQINVARDGRGVFMWHDTAWRMRQLLFLFLPILLHYLPGTPIPLHPLASLPPLAMMLENTLSRIRLLNYTRGAGMRVPALREASAAWWARERRESIWGLQDADVQRVAEGMNKGIGEGGQLRANARRAIEVLGRTALPPTNM